MANEVVTIITIQSTIPQTFSKIGEIIPESNKTDEIYYKLYEKDPTLEIDWDVYTEEVGSKWCYLEECSIFNEEAELIFVSAWNFPEGLFKQIYQHLSQIDPDTLMYCTYKDEAYNFVGAAAFGPNGYNNLEDASESYTFPQDNSEEENERFLQEVDDAISILKNICIKNSKKQDP